MKKRISTNLILTGLILILFSFAFGGGVSFIFIIAWNSPMQGFAFVTIPFMLITVAFFIVGLVCFFKGLCKRNVKNKGKSISGMILELRVETRYSSNRGFGTYEVYFANVQYTDEKGNLAEFVEQISANEYHHLHEEDIIPLLLFKGEAIIDKEKLKFNNEKKEKEDEFYK